MSASLNSPVPIERRPLRPVGTGAPTPARGTTSPLLMVPGRDTEKTEAIAFGRGVLFALAVLVMGCGVALALIAGNLDGAHLLAPALVGGGGAIVIRLVYLSHQQPTTPATPGTPRTAAPVVVEPATAPTELPRAVAEWRDEQDPGNLRPLLGELNELAARVAEWRAEQLPQMPRATAEWLLLMKACDADQHTKDRARGFDGLRAHLNVDGSVVVR